MPNSPPSLANTRRLGTALSLLIFAACGGGSSPTGSSGGGQDATLSGTVSTAASATVLAGATVKVGFKTTTTDANGHFSLTGLSSGAVTVSAERPGYTTVETGLSLAAGSNSHDFSLDVQEIYIAGTYAILVPAGAAPMRAAIIILGGPYTNSFVTGGQITVPVASNESQLQAYAAQFRALARSAHVALVGTSDITLGNTSISDAAIQTALHTVAVASDHPELETAPVVMVGLSSGGPEAAGFASRFPARTIGLLARVPAGVVSLATPQTLAIPTFIQQAELDEAGRNSSVQGVFEDNRARGGLWSLEVEKDAEHGTATDLANLAGVTWVADVMAIRIPGTVGAPLVALNETAGWLGNQGTHAIAAWANYVGDRTTASWMLTQAEAATWQSLWVNNGGGSLRQRVAPGN